MLRVQGALDENGIPVQISVDRLLDRDLAKVKKRCEGNWDTVIIVSGLPGMGKSVFGISTLAPILASKMSDIFITFDTDEFINTCAGDKTKEGDVVILDEGHNGMNSGRVAQGDFQRMMNLLMLVRQKRLYIIIISQNFFDLAKSIAIFRSNLLYHVTTSKGDKRGTFLTFDRLKKKNLYILGKKFLNYGAVPANYVGQFNQNRHLMPEDYMERKSKHLMDQNNSLKGTAGEKRTDMANRIIDTAILNLTKLNFKQKHIAKILGIALKTVSTHWSNMKAQGKVPDEYRNIYNNGTKVPVTPSTPLKTP